MSRVRELRFAVVKGAVNELDDDNRWYGGGESLVVKGFVSETAEMAKSSSSSFSSMISSGMTNVGGSLKLEPGRGGRSSDKNRRRDSGEMERPPLLLEAALVLRSSGTKTSGESARLSLSHERPRSSSRALLLNSLLQVGEALKDWFEGIDRSPGADRLRSVEATLGISGAESGRLNLASGFIVR